MVQERPVTPEKQLLKLIEDPKAKTTGVQTQTIKHQSLGLLSPQAWGGRLSFFREKARKWLGSGAAHQADIKAINRVLTLCIFALFLYFVSSVYFSFVDFKKMLDIDLDVKKVTALERAGDISLLKVASFYLEQVRQRNIFEMGKAKVIEGEEKTVIKRPSDESFDESQYLRLVGISWSDDPDVMIEDTNALRTYFVKRGESIGEFKVEAIFKDKVVLSRDGEEIELK